MGTARSESADAICGGRSIDCAGPEGVSYKIVNITKDSHPELDSMIQEAGWLFNHLHKLGPPADKIVR
ncbi:MAG: hypothetical protein ACKO32_16395 [Planctomycetia bacterium]